MSCSRAIVICGLLVTCAVLVRAFLPDFVAFGWHILHGDSVQFEAWEIPVPWGWREIKYEDLVIVQKLERGQDGYIGSEVTVGTLHLPIGAVLETEKLRTAMIEHNPGYQYLSESDLEMDGETGPCFNFLGSDASHRLLIDCSFPIHRLSIQYLGLSSRSQILASVAQNIRASK